MNRKLRRAAATGKRRHLDLQREESAPDFLDGFLSHGWQLLAEGRDEEAMEIAARAVEMEETDESKALFVQCVKSWSYFPGAEKIRDVLARALRESWGKTSDLIGLTRGLLDRDAIVGPAIQRASDAWPRRLPPSELLGQRGLGAIAANPLLLALLESSFIAGVNLERFVTLGRAGLLDMTGQGNAHVSNDILIAACAIARQCFSTEYIFDLTDGERANAGVLRARIEAAIVSGDEIRPLELVAFAGYQSLGSLSGGELLLERSWPEPVDAILDQQLREPAAERWQANSIPQLTSIGDGTSVRVREQYEDNPYPRWFGMPPAAPVVSVDEMIRLIFPFCGYQPTGKISDFDLLVAGCGTGQASILFARDFRDAKTLAIDLSLASLCYAKQKTQVLGMATIDYAQADILELGGIGRTFDVISAIGVLHHLADPEQGWRVLLSLLRPHGVMHIGLYSRAARRNLIAAHAWLAARGHTAGADDIRRARQDLAARVADEPGFDDVLSYADFYTMSGCRDLLFHTQNHEFDIPRIQAFLTANGLQFLGFQVDDGIRGNFWRRFSRECEANLSLWQEFEAENPDTFKGMYQFYVQKA
jgi:2-polyprenyl-3-methyl-5-hydroxy-6-metoxy-1,4-benzoquinol methylase